MATDMKAVRFGLTTTNRITCCGIVGSLLALSSIAIYLLLSRWSPTFRPPSPLQIPHREGYVHPAPLQTEDRKGQLAKKTDTTFYGDKLSKWKKDSEKIETFAKTVLRYDAMPDQCKSQPGFQQHKTWSRYSLTNYGPHQFLSSFRNPCWRHSPSQQLRCLPYFYLAGFVKCGTTDMYSRLVRHPLVVDAPKETHWITTGRFNGQSFDYYTKKYAAYLTKGPKNATISIVGDATPCPIWDSYHWALFPGNEKCREPRIINADHMRYMNPDVKIIVMLRNPSIRLYSEYLYFKKNVSVKAFHQRVERNLAVFSACVKRANLRSCVYKKSIYTSRVQMGLYSVFIEDWLLRFPREQMLFIRTEDVHDGAAVMPTVFSFLGIGVPDNLTMQEIVKLPRGNVGKLTKTMGPMWNKTRALLDTFYRPFNNRLAQILQDRRFSWEDSV